jgi:hypothetical protein
MKVLSRRLPLMLFSIIAISLFDHSYASPPKPAAVSLSSYLTSLFQLDESLQEAKAQLQIATAEANISQNLWASSLSYEVTQLNKTQRLSPLSAGLTTSFAERESLLTAALDQNLPWGLSLQVRGSKNLEPPSERFSTINQDLSLRLGVSLWRDAFGEDGRAEWRMV